ncbi:MAG TPA: aminoglycoside phosphotransferase family protein [Iamia sp.]|nr:aminoglycoside phosphotransferase family protein [Iamia sp.]
MAVPPGADAAAALAIVRRELDPEVAAIERIGEGEWSRCFAFRSGSRDLVVRIGAHREDFERDRRAAALAPPDLPVPEVLGLGEAPVGCWCISTRAWGMPLEHLDAAGWERALPSVLAMLGALAAVDVSAHPQWGSWDGSGRALHPSWEAVLLAIGIDDDPEYRVAGWLAALDAHPEDAALHRRGLAVLAELAADLDPPRGLVHGDLVNRNVLVSGDQVTAVFDWGCARYGDPLFDVAWLDVWTPWHPAIAEVRFRERALAHLGAHGLDLTDADARIRAIQIYILVEALGYSSLLGRVDDMAGIGARLRALL